MKKMILATMAFVLNFTAVAQATPDASARPSGPDGIICQSDKPFVLPQVLENNNISACMVPGTANEVVMRQVGQLQYCWERALAYSNGESRVNVKMSVLLSGNKMKVQKIETSGEASDPQSSMLKQCLTERLERLNIPLEKSLAEQNWALEGNISFRSN